ncbi:hypothetical protein G6F37_002825 [Rhizopus arrhizus]|nr:hypothetical protein G6F38_006682 [Rhizopus arrhizus]KAG1161721.1 hypothetical protein G6F37_002825 [Rhizopus arrhizus]
MHWRQFFGVMDVELSAIRKALYNLTFPRQKLRFIQNDTIVGCTFLGIWKAHWRLTFDDVPFDSNIVHNQILLMIAHGTTDDIVETPVLQSDNTSTIDPTDIIHQKKISCKASPRFYDEAVLYSSQQQHVYDEEKTKTLCLVDSLALQPIAITDRQGTEHIALTHPHVANKLVNMHESIKPILSSKRRYSDMIDKGALCVQCRTEVTDGLGNLLLMSPYTTLLSQRNFVEISEQVCHLLNSDWEFFPRFRLFSAMALADSILINVSNNQAVMLNIIEVYGRTKPVDIFCEPLGKLKALLNQHPCLPPSSVQDTLSCGQQLLCHLKD